MTPKSGGGVGGWGRHLWFCRKTNSSLSMNITAWFKAFSTHFGKNLPVTKFLQGLDLGFMKILHIFYNLMLNRPLDAMLWRIYSVCWSIHRLKLTPCVWTIGWSTSGHSIANDSHSFKNSQKMSSFSPVKLDRWVAVSPSYSNISKNAWSCAYPLLCGISSIYVTKRHSNSSYKCFQEKVNKTNLHNVQRLLTIWASLLIDFFSWPRFRMRVIGRRCFSQLRRFTLLRNHLLDFCNEASPLCSVMYSFFPEPCGYVEVLEWDF